MALAVVVDQVVEEMAVQRRQHRAQRAEPAFLEPHEQRRRARLAEFAQAEIRVGEGVLEGRITQVLDIAARRSEPQADQRVGGDARRQPPGDGLRAGAGAGADRAEVVLDFAVASDQVVAQRQAGVPLGFQVQQGRPQIVAFRVREGLVPAVFAVGHQVDDQLVDGRFVPNVVQRVVVVGLVR